MNKTPENIKDLNKGKDTIQSEIYALRDEISKAGKVLDVNKRKNIEARLSRLDNLVTKELQNEGNTAQDRKDLEQLRQSISTMKLNLNNTGDNNKGESYRTYMRSIQGGSTIEQSPREVITGQVNQTISSGSSNESTGTSALKTLGVIAVGVGIGALLYKGCKSLFGDDSESEDESEGQSDEAEESEESEENEESEESSEGTTGGSGDSQQEQQGEGQVQDPQQDLDQRLPEDYEVDQSLVDRFNNMSDLIHSRGKGDRIKHEIDKNSNFSISTLRKGGNEPSHSIFASSILEKGNKLHFPGFSLHYIPSTKRFIYFENNVRIGEINNGKVKEILDNSNDIINGNHNSLDKLIK